MPSRSRLAVPVLLAAALACAALLPAHHPDALQAPPLPAADTIRITDLGPGARHAFLWIADGPWAVHLIEIDEATCAPLIRAVKAGPPLAGRAATSALAGDAVAAINADFFLLPLGTPVGPHVRDGRILIGPGERAVYALDDRGGHRTGNATIHGFAAVREDSVAIVQVNRSTARDGLILFDHWAGNPEAWLDDGPALELRQVDGHRAVVVDGSREEGDAALVARGDVADGWVRRRAPGDTVRWDIRLLVAPARLSGAAMQAVGGHPVLLRDGKNALPDGLPQGFAEGRHPRTAVGWDEARRRLFWVVVDGRRPGYSEGMSLAELERLFIDLGATHAINLDGGGSSTLVVRGRVANRPSDPLGERAVANVLVLQQCTPSADR